MRARDRWRRLLLLTSLVCMGCDDKTPSNLKNSTAADAPSRASAVTVPQEPKSGYHFQSADTQALQDDPFANPGTLWLDQGAALWRLAPTNASASCASCHGELDTQPLRGVALNYPAFDTRAKRPLTLEARINRCRTEQQQQPAFEWESDALLGLTALVANQSKGMTITAAIDSALTPFLEAGRTYYYQRRGQMNLACHHCHERSVGRMLRGDQLSQGHSNGYPSYRLEWQRLGSLQRRLRFCNVGVRAEPHPFGAPEYVNLELFLKWRSKGLTVETPAVRR